jgi:hypothetical protein
MVTAHRAPAAARPRQPPTAAGSRLTNLPPDMLRLLASRLSGADQVHLASAARGLHAAQSGNLQARKKALADEEDRLASKVKAGVRALKEMAGVLKNSDSMRVTPKLSGGFTITRAMRKMGSRFITLLATHSDRVMVRGLPVFVELFLYSIANGKNTIALSVKADTSEGPRLLAKVWTDKSPSGATYTDYEVPDVTNGVPKSLLLRVLKRVPFNIKF